MHIRILFTIFGVAFANPQRTPAGDAVQLSKSKDPEERMFSVFILRKQLDELPASSISDVLQRLLQDSDSGVSARALQVIPFLPFEDDSKRREVCRSIQAIVQRKTKDPDQDAAFAAELALVKVNKGALSEIEYQRWLTSDVVPRVTSLSTGEDKSKERAAALLGAAGEYEDIATPELIERLLGSQAKSVVSATLTALREIVPKSQHTRKILSSRSVLAILGRLEKDDDEFIRNVAQQLRAVATSKTDVNVSNDGRRASHVDSAD